MQRQSFRRRHASALRLIDIACSDITKLDKFLPLINGDHSSLACGNNKMQILVLVILELLPCLFASQGMAVMQWLRLHFKKYVFSFVRYVPSR